MSEWKIFEKYHYLSHTINSRVSEKNIYILEYKNEPIWFCAIFQYPHPINKKLRKVHRLVIRPDYQWLWIWIKFLEACCDIYYQQWYDVRITTSSLSLLFWLKKRDNWICTYYDKWWSFEWDWKNRKSMKLRQSLRQTCSKDRYIWTFKYSPPKQWK